MKIGISRSRGFAFAPSEIVRPASLKSNGEPIDILKEGLSIFIETDVAFAVPLSSSRAFDEVVSRIVSTNQKFATI